MALNLNTSPYFDDFDDAKKFARILFKPGVAVQARELTQLQTILQDTIGNFADHIFKDGGKVKGAAGIIQAYDYIKINDVDASSATVSNDTLEDYIGDVVTGGTSGLKAEIVKAATGLDTDAVDKKTFYLKYTQGSNTGSYLHFEAGETLTVTSTVSDRNGDTFVVDNGTDSNDATRNYYGKGLYFTIEDGIIYVNGLFVYHTKQDIILEKYKVSANTYVGVKFTDSNVTSDDDSTLNDPATGTFNFNAPGADRYKVSTTIAKLGLTETNDDDFVSLYRIEDGRISRGDDVGDLDFYARLGEVLATRTKEESGDYVIRNFSITAREHLVATGNRGLLSSSDGGSADHVAIGVGRGVAYVNGHRSELHSPTYIKTNKANSTLTEEGFTVSTAYGNYVIVDEVAGNWNVKDGDLVRFGDTAANAVTDNTHSGHGAPSTIIGQARIRQIRYESGTVNSSSCKYRLYLYDIRMTAGTFADVRTIYYDDPSADGHADPVLESSKAVLKESGFNTMLFRAPFKNTKTLATDTGNTYDNNYTYQKEFNVQFATDGTATITVTGTESFPYSTTPTQSQLNTEFYMAFQAGVTISGGTQAGTYIAGEVFKLESAMITSISNTAINFDIGTSLNSATDVTMQVKVKQTDVTPVEKQARESRYVKIDTATNVGGSTGPYILGFPDVYKIEAIYVDGTTYQSSGTDYKDQFVLEYGQSDNYYGHSRLIVKPGATVDLSSKKITVKLSYFHPNYGGTVGTYFAVDSYPVDDTGSSGIYTYQIPRYVSPNYGIFDLRNCIDFRPYVVSTSTDSTTLSGASENPLESFEPSTVSGGFEFPIPIESFTTDAEYYIPRIDKVAINERGKVIVIEGAPDLDPTPPQIPENTMELAELFMPAYPTISPFLGAENDRKDMAIRIGIRQNKRYTMADVGNIDKRINRLEYYTALTLLEQETENLTIVDSSGNNRFKNGIFINPFSDHKLSNILDPDFAASIHSKKKFCTTNFVRENIDVVYDSVNSTGITRTGNLLTLPYSAVDYKANLNASKFRNLAGELTFFFQGDMELYPPSDNFTYIEDGGETQVPGTAFEEIQNNVSTALNNANLINDIDLTLGNPVEGPFEAVDTGDNGFGWWNSTTSQSITTQELSQQTSNVTFDGSLNQPVEQSFGDQIIDVGFAPFMRSQIVTVYVARLKPNTRYYAFFDGEDVNADCRPIVLSDFKSVVTANPDNFWSDFSDTTNDFNDSLVSSSTGEIALQFRIPAGRFTIGEKTFRLSDDLKNRNDLTTSAAESRFTSFGLNAVSTETIVSTQFASFQPKTISDDPETVGSFSTTNRVTTPAFTFNFNILGFGNLGNFTFGSEPLAQTFMITGDDGHGVFIPKVDLYFREKHATLGVTVEIRDVVNGYPGDHLVPYSQKYLEPSDVNISTTAEDGTVTFNETAVTFDSPVYLTSGKEYCIVLKPQGNNTGYTHWVSELGKNEVGTTNRITASDLTNEGVLFTSVNNRTWSAFQAEDLKFKLYRCDFTTDTDGVAKFTNFDGDYLKIKDLDTGVFAAGDKVHGLDITVAGGGSGHAVSDIVTLAGFGNGTGAKIKVLSVSSGAITTFEINDMGSGFTADGSAVAQSATTGSGTGATFNITTKTGTVERFSSEFQVARVKVTKSTFGANDDISNGTTDGKIDQIENKTFNTIKLNFGQIEFPDTSIAHEYDGTKSSGVSSKGTISRKLGQAETQVTLEEYAVYSESNETANLSGNKSFNSDATFSTSSNLVSPVVDLSRASYIVTKNTVNNDSTNEDSNNGGNSLSRYISKKVQLADGQEAQDIRVVLDQLTPVGSSVKVYGKFRAPEDEVSDFREELNWIELSLVETPKNDGESNKRFIEYEYKLSDANLDGNDIFEYDVKRVNATTITAGGSGYTSPPTVTFSGGTSTRQAKGFAVLSGGAVSEIVITDPGRYTGSTAPTITISGGGGSSATATSTIGTATFKEFKEFAIKVVFLSSNTSNVPKIRNLRAIALQA
jgi:hypothetical protein